MALWFDLKIGAQTIGGVEIRRTEPFDLRDPAVNERWFVYDVRRDGRLVGQVRHRYGDGAWRLLALAADLVDGIDASIRRAQAERAAEAFAGSSAGRSNPEAAESISAGRRDG